ncbi:acyltransferase [Serratia ureilytica]|uniref:acyltransferase family protein n=1 Tax=Serratia ureilytica TaxID=300181 RepID=UPI00254B4BD7|nr:acyltransferase [Serratia ureilytica]MDK7596307.1 acyltransferase [Serratia ureilytica]
MNNRNIIPIQWLRAVAVTLVVCWHVMVKAHVLNITTSDYFYIGNSGVDLFFVISGFIMAYTAQRNANGVEFILRRIIRILPLYWLISIFALLVYLYNPSMVNSNSPHTTLINSFTLIPIENYAMLVDVGWTLRYEFIFYLILSLSFMSGKTMGLVICSIIMIILPTIGLIVNSNEFYFTFITNPLLIEFSLGIIAFYASSNSIIQKNHNAIIISGLTLLVLIELYAPFINRCFKYGVPMMLVLIGARNIKIHENIFSKILCIVGNASYSIYLTHMFTIGLSILILKSTIYGSKYDIIFIPASIIASIVAGVACFYIIETPLLKISKKALSNNKSRFLGKNRKVTQIDTNP